MSTIEKSIQEITLEKISKSIQESCTLEKIISTEQFLILYYRQFPFTLSFFKQEWILDSLLKERKEELAMLDEEVAIDFFSKHKTSLRRMNVYIKALSSKELQASRTEIQLQLEGIDPLELSAYTSIHEKVIGSKPSFISLFFPVKELLEVA